jgi:hypothetical protein
LFGSFEKHWIAIRNLDSQKDTKANAYRKWANGQFENIKVYEFNINMVESIEIEDECEALAFVMAHSLELL